MMHNEKRMPTQSVDIRFLYVMENYFRSPMGSNLRDLAMHL